MTRACLNHLSSPPLSQLGNDSIRTASSFNMADRTASQPRGRGLSRIENMDPLEAVGFVSRGDTKCVWSIKMGIEGLNSADLSRLMQAPGPRCARGILQTCSTSIHAILQR